jgi:hypothetical protein
MSIVFCRGCGKDLHETTKMCPHCGFQYGDSSLSSARSKSIWMTVVSSNLALMTFITWFSTTTWEGKDLFLGQWMVNLVSLILSLISLSQNRRGRTLNVISVGVSGLTILWLIGKL